MMVATNKTDFWDTRHMLKPKTQRLTYSNYNNSEGTTGFSYKFLIKHSLCREPYIGKDSALYCQRKTAHPLRRAAARRLVLCAKFLRGRPTTQLTCFDCGN